MANVKTEVNDVKQRDILRKGFQLWRMVEAGLAAVVVEVVLEVLLLTIFMICLVVSASMAFMITKTRQVLWKRHHCGVPQDAL